MKMNKNILTMALVGILTIGSSLPIYANKVEVENKSVIFTDLEQNKWYTEAVTELSEKGILKGHKGLVRPNDNIKRAEYAQVLHNIMQEEGLLDISGTDVSPNAWYFDAMRASITFGIIRGDGYDTYRPNDPVTREEVFVMTSRAFQLAGMEESNKDLTLDFKDHKDLSSWAKNDTNALIAKGYLKGDQTKSLLPKKNITRAELASLIKDMKEVKELPKIINVKKDKTVVTKPADKPAEKDKLDYEVPDWVNEPAKVWVEEEGHFEDIYKEKLVENALIVVHPAKYEIEITTEYIFHEHNNPGYGATFYSAKEASEYQRMLAELRDPKIYGNYQVREIKHVTDRLIEPEREEVIRPAKYEKVKVGEKWIVDKPGYWKEVE